jgi:hypothetical protein
MNKIRELAKARAVLRYPAAHVVLHSAFVEGAEYGQSVLDEDAMKAAALVEHVAALYRGEAHSLETDVEDEFTPYAQTVRGAMAKTWRAAALLENAAEGLN